MGEWPAPPLPAGWTISGQPPFVARQDEVAAIEAAWADVVGGAGRAVFVSGEPGTGKSRLVSEVCTRLHASGAAVLFGSCIQELGAPFEPFDEPLRVLLPAYRDQASDGVGAESGELLERVLDRSVPDAAARAASQDRVLDAAVDVLHAATTARPLVLVLDDLHWAGPVAIRLLNRVVTAMRRDGLLLIGTLRSDPPDRSGALTDVLAALSRLDRVHRIELAPFTSDEITDYVVACAGLTRAGARESAEVLGDLTGGNPFLLRAMWRRVVEAEHRGGRRVIELPDSVGDLVLSRLTALDPGQREVLQLAAVLGQEVDLSEVLGLSAASVDDTLAAMDAAVNLGLIEPPRAAGDRYRFPHAIARQAVIDAMPNSELLRMHARIAQGLESDFATAPRLVQRLAHHYEAARALGFGDRAVTYLGRAAELAEGRYAYEDAGRLHERAASIATDGEERAELLIRAAADWDLAADTSHARELYEQAADAGTPPSATASGDRVRGRLVAAGSPRSPRTRTALRCDRGHPGGWGRSAVRRGAGVPRAGDGVHGRGGRRGAARRPSGRARAQAGRSPRARLRAEVDLDPDAPAARDREAAGALTRAARTDPPDEQRVDGCRDAAHLRELLPPRRP